jgi:small subunit ribosomal protein S6e
MKFILNDVKTGKTYSTELKEDQINLLDSLKMTDKFSGDSIGYPGYEFEITGGSDSAGFPMRFDVQGSARKKITLTQGPCVKINRNGMKKKVNVAGNTVKKSTSQVNAMIVTYGKKEIASYFASKEKEAEPTENKEKVKEAPKEEVRQEVKKEQPKEAVKEQPKEEVKTESKTVREKPNQNPK